MALRCLAGKLRVPAGAALRRAQGSRGVASRSSQLESAKEAVEGDAPSAAQWRAERQRMSDFNEAFIRQLKEVASARERYDRLEALYVTTGSMLGLVIGALFLRYEHHNGHKIKKMVMGLPKD